MAHSKRGPHDVFSEITLTVRHHIPSAASPTEAEQTIEDRLAGALEKANQFLGGDIVEKELLNVAAEPTGRTPEFRDGDLDDDDQGKYDW